MSAAPFYARKKSAGAYTGRAQQWRSQASRQAPSNTISTPATTSAPATKKPNKVEGDPALWITLQRVTDEVSGWTKTTRAMQTPAGVLINTCSRKRGADALVAEALALLPGTKLEGTRILPL
jgi:hypothetical protein